MPVCHAPIPPWGEFAQIHHDGRRAAGSPSWVIPSIPASTYSHCLPAQGIRKSLSLHQAVLAIRSALACQQSHNIPIGLGSWMLSWKYTRKAPWYSFGKPVCCSIVHHDRPERLAPGHLHPCATDHTVWRCPDFVSVLTYTGSRMCGPPLTTPIQSPR